MVEATPVDFCDRCHRCDETFTPGEARWLEARAHFVHTACARWELWDAPPYGWKLKELRRRYRDATGAERERIVAAGRAIRRMQNAWPIGATERVTEVLEAVRVVG